MIRQQFFQDNGCGIHPDDTDQIANRFHSSKLKSVEDVYKIKTLGFRGEALSSMALIGMVTIVSKRNGNETGIRVTIKGLVVQILLINTVCVFFKGRNDSNKSNDISIPGPPSLCPICSKTSLLEMLNVHCIKLSNSSPIIRVPMLELNLCFRIHPLFSGLQIQLPQAKRNGFQQFWKTKNCFKKKSSQRILRFLFPCSVFKSRKQNYL